MTDLTKLKELAERALGSSFSADAMSSPLGQFSAAANPQAILGLIAEVERLRNLEVRQQEIAEHYKKWFKEIVYESFDEWLKDDATHWIGEQDAALQAWQHLHENKIWLMKERIEQMQVALQAVHAEVDGNIRPLTRDLVNMVSGVKNGSHPNDIYDHCDEIDRIIDAALEGDGK